MLSQNQHTLQIHGNVHYTLCDLIHLELAVVFSSSSQTTTFGAACAPADPSTSKVTPSDIAIILELHNNYRRKVAQGNELRGNPGPQPQASNMRQLV